MRNDSLKVISLAKKIAALAEKGATNGEQKAAEKMLNDFLKKNGLTLADLESETKRNRTFEAGKIDSEKAIFFSQIFRNVVGRQRDLYRITEYGRKSMGLKRGNYVTAEITDVEYFEIKAKFDFYWNHWQKERKLFYSAYIQQNKLFVKPDESDLKTDSNLSTDDLRRMFEMMETIERKSHSKQLNG